MTIFIGPNTIIAAGLSPFNPESVAVAAGRLMLTRIDELLQLRVDFAFETTLATRSYVSLIKRAKKIGYKITLIFIWLKSPEVALQRVADRVQKGGHNIPPDVVVRRYYRGIHNMINLYIPVSDIWIVMSTNDEGPAMVAVGAMIEENMIFNSDIWNNILDQTKQNGNHQI